MYSSAKKVGVARSQARSVRSTKLAPTRAARRGAAPSSARTSASRRASTRSVVRAATDTLSLSARAGRALVRALKASPGDGASLCPVSPQRRIAFVSVVAALVLIALKLVTGLATGSLGLLSEAAHSGTDFVAALLVLFAVGVAGRPADPSHLYGHGKAEHLSALAEASILVGLSILIAFAAIRRLVDGTADVDATWYAFLVIVIVMVIDASRATVSHRAARAYRSPAFGASAVHFASDLAGS